MTTDPEPFDAILDAAFAPEGFPEESDYDLDKPGVLAGIGPDAEAAARAALDEAREAWRIDGERTAAWALSRYRRARDRRMEAHATAAAVMAQLEVYLDDVTRRTEHDVAFFTGKLRQWYEEVGGEGKTKTRHVLGGSLSASIGGVSCQVSDDPEALDELIAWLEDNGRSEALKYPDRPTIVKAELAGYKGKVDTVPGTYPAVDAATGELLPGVEFVRGEPTFKITLDDPDDAAE